MKNTTSIVSAICIVIIYVLTYIIIPVIIFWAGYFGGWILMNLVGERVADGFNLLFGTSRFTRELIPIACGTLATIGSYFKSVVSGKEGK